LDARVARRSGPDRHANLGHGNCSKQAMEPALHDFSARHPELRARLYLQGASFCFSDLERAVASLDLADTAFDSGVRERHLDRAREILARVLHVVPRLQLNDEDLAALNAIVASVRRRLSRWAWPARTN
jgi:hypothetical protein